MTSADPHPYERLSHDLVMDAIESLGYRCDARIFGLNSYENRVYQVGIEDETPLIAKFYRPQRWSQDQIEEEHAFSQELADCDIPAVAPLQRDGRSLFEYQGFMFALFPRRGGHPLELDNEEQLHVMGRYLGRLHQVGKAHPFAHRPTLGIEEFGYQSRAFLLDGDWLPRDLRLPYETITADILKAIEHAYQQAGDYPSIRLHGDCHAGNVLWRDDTPHMVDFDDARSGPAIQDIWMLLSGDRDGQQRQLMEVIEGYEQFCDFEARQLWLVEPLRTLRIMHYAAWLARRWQDPAFPMNFPWFNSERYWAEHILSLREQQAMLQEPPLALWVG